MLLALLLVAVTRIAAAELPSLTASEAALLVKDSAERTRIEEAVPKQPVVRPRQPRRLLIFDLNVGYGGHPSAAHAAYTLTLAGEKTGAFKVTYSRDPEVFRRDTLRQFDAVFFDNTVGNLFTDPELRQNLAAFVTGGGGLLGTHGTSVAFTRWPGAIEDWPEFGIMLCARGANHRDSDERALIKVDDPGHPLTEVFGTGSFEFRDEFFRFQEVYSRNRVRVLLSLDMAANPVPPGAPRGNVVRADNDYALAWVRNYGRGRVFYSTIAHNPWVFWDPRMVRFYFAAVQFALGDLPAPTVPSARLTPAVRAQEKLGWRLGIEAYTFQKYTFFEAIDKTSQLGLNYIGGLSFQKVSDTIPRNFDEQLTDDELRQIRLKLDAAGLRLLTFFHHRIPAEAAGARKVFEFGRKLGIEVFIGEPPAETLDVLGPLCDEFDIRLALHNHDRQGSPVYWQPEGVLQACQGRTRRIGACPDIGYWLRSGIDPIRGLQTLGDRLMTIQLHDLNDTSPQGHDVPWGTGAGRTESILREIRRLGVTPVMFGLEYSYNWLESMPEIARTAEFFNQVSLSLAP